jgi:cell division protein FtsW
MFVGKVDLRNVFSLFMLGLGLFAAMIFLSEVFPEIRVDTWISRLYNFVNGADSGDNFQVEQAKMAIARGGYFGVGPGNGVQSHFLPHAYSDYIYCIIVEEYGLVGGIIILALYLALIVRTFRMVNKTPKTFGAMLAVGLSLSITIQAFTHMAVNVNLVPVTGLTLPFVSLGGTSLMFTGLAFGIILSVSRSFEKNTNNKSKENSIHKTESDNQEEEFSVRNE